MIAYKVFIKRGKELSTVWMRKSLACDFEPYNPEEITLRADGCGPFACFKTLPNAQKFATMLRKNNHPCTLVIHKVEIIKSKATTLWVDDYIMVGLFFNLPEGTVLADEFEILERIKL